MSKVIVCYHFLLCFTFQIYISDTNIENLAPKSQPSWLYQILAPKFKDMYERKKKTLTSNNFSKAGPIFHYQVHFFQYQDINIFLSGVFSYAITYLLLDKNYGTSLIECPRLWGITIVATIEIYIQMSKFHAKYFFDTNYVEE